MGHYDITLVLISHKYVNFYIVNKLKRLAITAPMVPKLNNLISVHVSYLSKIYDFVL